MDHAGRSSFVLLRLRWLQFSRSFPPYGRVLLVLALALGVRLLFGVVEQDRSLSGYIAGGMVALVWGLHQRRTDHHFLHRHLRRPRAAMALEYAVLALPVSIALLLAQAWYGALWVWLVAVWPWIPVVPVSGVRGRWLRKRVPARLVEWRSMVQHTYPWSLLLWLAALGLCWLPVLPLFLLGALALISTGAQEQCEPRTMLLATADDARGLLRLKVSGAVRIMSVLQLPVLIAATVFQPGWWWVHLLFGLGMLVLVSYAVVLKYANYRPNERLDANGANVGVAAMFAILPGLGLVPLIMLLTEVPKARANLKAYFHAHHR